MFYFHELMKIIWREARNYLENFKYFKRCS